MKYNFIIIHGIGDAKEGYSKTLQKNIKNLFKPDEEIKFYEYLWSDEIREGENELLSNLTNVNISYNKQRKWFTVHISDVVAYLRDKVIANEIKENLRKILNKLLSDSNSINIIIAHSLGSVIAFDVLKGYYEHGLQADYFFTLGSPLAIFINDFQKDKTYFDPIPVKKGWLNIFSPNDIIAYPLQNIDELWHEDIVQDKVVKFGGLIRRYFPIIHSDYLKNKKVAKIIVDYVNEINVKKKGGLK